MKIKEYLIKEASEEGMWKEFANLLKSHDWMYEMTSGPAYQKGKKEADRLNDLKQKLRKIDKPKVVEYYKKYIPKHILNYFVSGWEENILTDKW